MFSDPTSFLINALYLVPGLILGLVCHEFAHAAVAVWRGDPTPRIDGRLSLNPRNHLDPIGTIAVLLIGFGWAKPVRINPARFRGPLSAALVAAAGPLANLLIAYLLAIPLKLGVLAGSFSDSSPLWHLADVTFTLNVVLAVFNILPIPPLDGYSFVSALFRRRFPELFFRIDSNRMTIMLVFVLVLVVGGYLLRIPLLGYLASPVARFILSLPPFPIGA